MKLAFSSSVTGDGPVREMLARFRHIGYDGLQLKPPQYSSYLDEPRRFLDEWGDLPGAASALIAGGTLDGPGQAHLRRIFALGKIIGTETIVFCHGVPRAGLSADDIRGLVRPLAGVAEVAADHGLRFSLHHHFDQPVMHRDDIRHFFAAAAAARAPIGLTIDTAHLARSGITDIAGVIREFASHIDNFHLKDFGDGEFQMLGRGAIPLAPIFAAIREIGYAGWISADEESGAHVCAAMEECYRVLSQGLGEQVNRGVS